MQTNPAVETPVREKLVRIHIDQKQHESPSPTTGMALYRLGHVPPGLELYLEVSGDHEDALIVDGPKPLHLKTDEHFHSGAPAVITLIVDGTPEKWDKPEISYAEVVTLADPDYPKHPELIYSVKYKHGPGHKPEGILAPGAFVKVKNKMSFNVSKTGQS
jgi:hypothetical protein